LLERKDNPGAWAPGRSPRSMAAPIRDRLRSRLAHLSFLITRPMTLGVRAVVIGREESVLLVRHGYVSGWHFPGGGVEVGETCLEALARELKEEASVALEGPPLLHGLFFKARPSRRDHVAVYLVRAFRVIGERAPDREIEEARFFPRSALPEGTTGATRSRLAEIFDSAPISDRW
jgi:ADP-ribose pyrophosphatase YjhB (NUDIX family)